MRLREVARPGCPVSTARGQRNKDAPEGAPVFLCIGAAVNGVRPRKMKRTI